jgi:hypothetical protein
MKKRAMNAQDELITAAYRKVGSNKTVPMMQLPKIYDAGRKAQAVGGTQEDIEAAMAKIIEEVTI